MSICRDTAKSEHNIWWFIQEQGYPGAPEGTGRTSLLSFSFSQTTVAKLKLPTSESIHADSALRPYCKRITGTSRWIQSKADARTPEVKANRKLGNKGTSIDFRLVPHPRYCIPKLALSLAAFLSKLSRLEMKSQSAFAR